VVSALPQQASRAAVDCRPAVRKHFLWGSLLG
jgi:hypothetical protein